MTKAEAIDYISKEKKFFYLCKKITKGNELYNDLYQESLLIMLEYSEDYFKEIKCLDCLVFKIIYNMWASNTSSFWRKYRKPLEMPVIIIEDDDKIEQEKLLNKIESILSRQYWYDREIFKKVIEEGSMGKLSRKTKISKMSISRTYRKVKKKILS